jgi:hypothetical protein
MKVLISCTENPKNCIEVLDELEFFIDKKVIFYEKKISVGPPPASKFCNPHIFFSFQLLLFRLRFSELNLSPIFSGSRGKFRRVAPLRIFGSYKLLRN